MNMDMYRPGYALRDEVIPIVFDRSGFDNLTAHAALADAIETFCAEAFASETTDKEFR